MYSDLFDALGGGAASNSNSSSNANREEVKPLLSFKAGKVNLSLQENGKYWAAPDTRRGQVNLKYNDDDQLTWEWYDRREKKVMDTILITDPVKLERADVPKSTDADSNDRVYFWKLDNTWKVIWLQDKQEDKELIGKVNDILKKPKKPAEGGDAAAAPGDGPVSARSPGNASTSSASTTTRQVDALSNILENLGMPQGEGARNAAAAGAAASSTSASAPSPAATAGGGTLTLADLQGVMAGLQTPQASPAGLHDVVSSEAIKDLLENEDVRNRLIQELPEGQRTAEDLEENLRSPQVQQTLRVLTAALMPDDNGSMDGYHSVLANFQLDAADGQQALTESNNPIQAFLDCVLASVKKDEKKEESKDEEMKE